MKANVMIAHTKKKWDFMMMIIIVVVVDAMNQSVVSVGRRRANSRLTGLGSQELQGLTKEIIGL